MKRKGLRKSKPPAPAPAERTVERLARLVDGAQARNDAQQKVIAAYEMRVAVLEGVVEGLSAVVEEVRGKARPMIIDEVDWQTGEITPAIAVCILPTKEEPC